MKNLEKITSSMEVLDTDKMKKIEGKGAVGPLCLRTNDNACAFICRAPGPSGIANGTCNANCECVYP